MIATFAFLGVLILNSGLCVEINSVELSPFYDAIIFGDIAEIINDFDNNMNFSTDKKRTSESASDEEVESLLSEYQQYLEKAQKQRTKHFEKTKSKNKIPLLRHEKFSKLNFPTTYYNDRNHNYYPSNIQLSQKVFNPYDYFAPMQLDRDSLFDTTIWYNNKMNGFPSSIYKTGTNAISSCFCEENKFPCKCSCKQCLIPLGKTQATYFEPTKIFNNDNPLITSGSFKNIGYSNENPDDLSERKLNIRIKVDVQMPKIDNVLKKIQKGYNPLEDTDTYTSMNVSIPPLNFPIPLNIITYGLSKLYNFDNAPIHKISFHNKKKSHSNYQNKKHRSKYLSFHHAKASSYQTLRTTEKYNNNSHNLNDTPEDKQLKIQINITQALEPSATVNISNLNPILNDTFVNVPALVNVSSDDNLVEMDFTTQKTSDPYYTRWTLNNTTETLQFIRIKREDDLSKLAIINNDTLSNNLLKVKGVNTSIGNTATTKDNKQLLLDSDLLYWPSKVGNNANDTSFARKVQLKEDNFNISEYIMYVNSSGHTDKPLININWNDIDIVVSMFSSLVGKNMNGILSFCSETLCLSLNCAEKMCVHRSCTPKERFNQRGHCSVNNAVSNETDSKLSTESSTNISSNIAFDLIDILQDHMLGQIFGKATICINLKCISFVANKKVFTKSKCSKKELNSEGHCDNFKKS